MLVGTHSHHRKSGRKTFVEDGCMEAELVYYICADVKGLQGSCEFCSAGKPQKPPRGSMHETQSKLPHQHYVLVPLWAEACPACPCGLLPPVVSAGMHAHLCWCKHLPSLYSDFRSLCLPCLPHGPLAAA
eukprot:1161965-Pelagomonas_calceolata.AAC.12